MIKYFIILFLLLISGIALADGVDVATFKVNGTLVRKVGNNKVSGPYLINLSKFKEGDTLDIDIWTDHFGENDCFVTIKNLETEAIDTLNRKHTCILTNELINNLHSVKVTFNYSKPKLFQIPWEICHIVPDPQIETVYASINALRDLLLSFANSKADIKSSMLSDTISTNFNTLIKRNGEVTRTKTDTLSYPIGQLTKILKFSVNEEGFLNTFNSINYNTFYDYTTKVHGGIYIDEKAFESFNLYIGDFYYSVAFRMEFKNDNYKLVGIYYSTRKIN